MYVANIDGTGVQHATRFTEQESPPTWTPDGAKIVLPRVVGSSLVRNVYSQSPVANPGDVTQLTNFTLGTGGAPACPIIFFDSDVLVAISTQGKLAFACFSGEIDVLSSNGTLSASYLPSRNDRRHWPNVFSPSWSPDGTRLAFVETTSDSATNYNQIGLAVKVMNADGSNVTTVATGAGSNAQVGGGWIGPNNFSPCWMPDGSRLVFNVPESGLRPRLPESTVLTICCSRVKTKLCRSGWGERARRGNGRGRHSALLDEIATCLVHSLSMGVGD